MGDILLGNVFENHIYEENMGSQRWLRRDGGTY
jgi:hypothetical protein